MLAGDWAPANDAVGRAGWLPHRNFAPALPCRFHLPGSIRPRM